MALHYRWTIAYYIVMIIYYILSTVLFAMFVFYRQSYPQVKVQPFCFEGVLAPYSNHITWTSVNGTQDITQQSAWSEFRLQHWLQRNLKQWTSPSSSSSSSSSTTQLVEQWNEELWIHLPPGAYWLVLHSSLKEEGGNVRGWSFLTPSTSADQPILLLEPGRVVYWVVTNHPSSWFQLLPPNTVSQTRHVQLHCLPIASADRTNDQVRFERIRSE